MLIDSHCHLNFKDFHNEVDKAVNDAVNNGVSGMVTICTELEEFEEVYEIAEKFNNVWASLGVHPDETGKKQLADVATLLKFGQRPKVVGIGETGLDYYRTKEFEKIQKESFRIHIEAARQLDLPIIVHTRDADADTAEILAYEAQKGGARGVLHCFTSGKELAFKAIDMGFYISFSGIITFKSAESIREIAKNIPLENILVETDAPFLAPTPHRGKRNEPAFVKHTAEFLAHLRGISFEELAEATTANFFRLFSRAKETFHA